MHAMPSAVRRASGGLHGGLLCFAGMWSLRSAYAAEFDKYLVQTFIGETLMFSL
jgi:hypothetical protein